MDVKYEPPRDFLVRKGGYFYRPNAQGYTANPAEAGRFTFSEAWDHSHPNGEDGPRDGITFIHESEIDEPAQTALTTAQSEAAELRAEVERCHDALWVIAERPGTGFDRWGGGVSENEHMAQIAQDTLEGNEHPTVCDYRMNRAGRCCCACWGGG